jgi:hypothetical protein
MAQTTRDTGSHGDRAAAAQDRVDGKRRKGRLKNHVVIFDFFLDKSVRPTYLRSRIRSNAMQMTAHIDARMNQRGIRKDLVELALDLGEIEGGRYVLTSKMIDVELEGVRRRMKILTEARKKGGVVVVAEGEALITTYRANSFNAKLSKNNQTLTMI